jgi:hypothetical protein
MLDLSCFNPILGSAIIDTELHLQTRRQGGLIGWLGRSEGSRWSQPSLEALKHRPSGTFQVRHL